MKIPRCHAKAQALSLGKIGLLSRFSNSLSLKIAVFRYAGIFLITGFPVKINTIRRNKKIIEIINNRFLNFITIHFSLPESTGSFSNTSKIKRLSKRL